MALKYISKTMDDIKKRPADSEQDPSILEEILLRGMSPKDTIVTVIDLLMTGIDTVNIIQLNESIWRFQMTFFFQN